MSPEVAAHFIAASVAEQEALLAELPRRRAIMRALRLVSGGCELGVGDIDSCDLAFRTEYNRALDDVKEEKKHQERAAAALLARERLAGRIPT
jgi:hypothetical protein